MSWHRWIHSLRARRNGACILHTLKRDAQFLCALFSPYPKYSRLPSLDSPLQWNSGKKCAASHDRHPWIFLPTYLEIVFRQNSYPDPRLTGRFSSRRPEPSNLSRMNAFIKQSLSIHLQSQKSLGYHPLIQNLTWLGSLFFCSDDRICHTRSSDEILAKQTTFRVTVVSSKFLGLCPKGLCIDARTFIIPYA